MNDNARKLSPEAIVVDLKALQLLSGVQGFLMAAESNAPIYQAKLLAEINAYLYGEAK